MNQSDCTDSISPRPVCSSPHLDALISIQDVAHMLNCSSRHVYRLVDTRRIPQPIKLGVLLRWIKSDFDRWIAAGCPDCRKR